MSHPRRPFLCLFTLLALAGLPGCYLRQAFYVSPFNGNTADYHTQPMVRDSARSAVYVSGTYFTGGANDNHTDYYNAFHTEVYRSHHGKFLQGFYGLDLTLGDFATGRWDTTLHNNWNPRYGPPVNAVALNHFAGHRFFGGTGFNGGMNLVMPFRNGEWRYIGLETSLRREFGDYLSFRKQLPDSVATMIVRNNFYGTMGLSSEICLQIRDGELGFRLATGWVLGGDYNYLSIYNNATGGPLRFHYTSFSFHYSHQQYTGFLQTNFATKALALHLGINYRLSKPKLRSRSLY